MHKSSRDRKRSRSEREDSRQKEKERRREDRRDAGRESKRARERESHTRSTKRYSSSEDNRRDRRFEDDRRSGRIKQPPRGPVRPRMRDSPTLMGGHSPALGGSRHLRGGFRTMSGDRMGLRGRPPGMPRPRAADPWPKGQVLNSEPPEPERKDKKSQNFRDELFAKAQEVKEMTLKRKVEESIQKRKAEKIKSAMEREKELGELSRSSEDGEDSSDHEMPAKNKSTESHSRSPPQDRGNPKQTPPGETSPTMGNTRTKQASTPDTLITRRSDRDVQGNRNILSAMGAPAQEESSPPWSQFAKHFTLQAEQKHTREPIAEVLSRVKNESPEQSLSGPPEQTTHKPNDKEEAPKLNLGKIEVAKSRSPSVSPSPGKTTETGGDSPTFVGSPPSPFKRPTELPEELKEEPFDPDAFGCRKVDDEYTRLNTIDEGMYGVVHRAKNKKTGEIVALKKIKMDKSHSGFPITSIREITLLLSLNHPNIVNVKEVVVDQHSLAGVYMVMEYMEHDMKALMLMKKKPFSCSEVKCLMLQLLAAVENMHENWILHRDIKTSNLLLNNKGVLKVCDLGMARRYGDPIKPYTSVVVTLWYRSPELLLGAKTYSTAVDMWSVGCVMAEFLTNKPLFPGKTEIEQVRKIWEMLGSPTETTWPGHKELRHAKMFNFGKHKAQIDKYFPGQSPIGQPTLSASGKDLLLKLLTYDPKKRISAENAIQHPWFKESPKPQKTDMMPTFPSLNEEKRRRMKRRRPSSPHVRPKKDSSSSGFKLH